MRLSHVEVLRTKPNLLPTICPTLQLSVFWIGSEESFRITSLALDRCPACTAEFFLYDWLPSAHFTNPVSTVSTQSSRPLQSPRSASSPGSIPETAEQLGEVMRHCLLVLAYCVLVPATFIVSPAYAQQNTSSSQVSNDNTMEGTVASTSRDTL